MARTILSLRLPAEQIAALDRLAGSNGFNRSQLVETIVADFLAEEFAVQRARLRNARGPHAPVSSNE
jgi:metal-responsive CopG/Arc/MetJ family transcriptional regulator